MAGEHRLELSGTVSWERAAALDLVEVPYTTGGTSLPGMGLLYALVNLGIGFCAVEDADHGDKLIVAMTTREGLRLAETLVACCVACCSGGPGHEA